MIYIIIYLFPGEVNVNPFQYSCLENPMGRWAWLAAVHGVTSVRHDLATKPVNTKFIYYYLNVLLFDT